MPDQTLDHNAEVHKRIAASCNDAAWVLIEKNEPGEAELAQLATLAATARYHWHKVGNPGNLAHADLLFAWALARNGAGKAALHLAAVALEHFKANDSLPWELAFAHAAMAAACQSNGELEGYRQHYAQAKDLGAQLSGKDAQYFIAAFRNIPEDTAP